jgi:hypothetical protein
LLDFQLRQSLNYCHSFGSSFCYNSLSSPFFLLSYITMKNAMFTSVVVALLTSSVCAITVGDGVPLIYASTPYSSTIYNGTQYNATTINGVVYNASNEWPCLNEHKYESIIPSCSLTCISYSLARDLCDPDDFACHCTAAASARIDTNVIPCLTSGPGALCNGVEIGRECKSSNTYTGC